MGGLLWRHHPVRRAAALRPCTRCLCKCLAQAGAGSCGTQARQHRVQRSSPCRGGRVWPAWWGCRSCNGAATVCCGCNSWSAFKGGTVAGHITAWHCAPLLVDTSAQLHSSSPTRRLYNHMWAWQGDRLLLLLLPLRGSLTPQRLPVLPRYVVKEGGLLDGLGQLLDVSASCLQGCHCCGSVRHGVHDHRAHLNVTPSNKSYLGTLSTVNQLHRHQVVRCVHWDTGDRSMPRRRQTRPSTTFNSTQNARTELYIPLYQTLLRSGGDSWTDAP
jgi:hypothetical protein